MGPLELVAILATRWRHLSFASRTFCHHMMSHPFFPHFGHQMELLALIANLATRRHHLHQLQIGSPKFSHQLAQLALLPKLSTRLCYLHCYIALDCPIVWLSWYPHQPESHQLSLHKVCDGHPDPKIRPQVYLGPIKKSKKIQHIKTPKSWNMRPDSRAQNGFDVAFSNTMPSHCHHYQHLATLILIISSIFSWLRCRLIFSMLKGMLKMEKF